MNKDTDVFRQILELLGTLTEGLEYTSAILTEGNSDEAMEMTYNILTGIESIINAYKPYMEQIDCSNLKVLEASMYNKINAFIDFIKVNNLILLENNMNNNVIPAFGDWKREIERLLTPYTLS